MRLSGGLCTRLFIFMNQRFFRETAIILLSSSSVLWPIHKKALGTIAVWSRRLVNGTFAGQAILGACCSIIKIQQNGPKAGKQIFSLLSKGEKERLESRTWLFYQKVGEGNTYSLVTVIDCQFLGLLSVQGTEWRWSYSVLWSHPPLCCRWSLGYCIQYQ